MNDIIHVGKIEPEKKSSQWLFLKKIGDHFHWFIEDQPTDVSADHVEEAIRLAKRKWTKDGFTPLLCGFRFTLPERDEHGNNALFHQMVKSLNSMNGIYFDEDVGHHCIVHQIPIQARDLYKKLQAASVSK